MTQKENIKYLMEKFIKKAQETDLKSALQGNPTDPKKNFLVLDNLIAKLKKDLSSSLSTDFTAAKDAELFVQDLTNASSFIKYLYDNKIAFDGKQLALDHNATGVEKFIDLEYSRLSTEVKQLYFAFPQDNQDYWVYKDGIEKFLQSKMEEAEKSTDQGFKNILKTLLNKLAIEINLLSPSLKVAPKPQGPTDKVVPGTGQTTDKPGTDKAGDKVSPEESVLIKWLENPERLPLYRDGVTLHRINAFAEQYLKATGSTVRNDANDTARVNYVHQLINNLMVAISNIRATSGAQDTLSLTLPVPQRNIGSRSTTKSI